MFYAAKCYWPGVTEQELERLDARLVQEEEAAPRGASELAFVGTILFPEDALVLCLFEAASRSTVLTASRRASIPCDRVMELVWLGRPQSERREKRSASCRRLRDALAAKTHERRI